MKTKEIYLSESLKKSQEGGDDYLFILEAMDEYAKEMAIAFAIDYNKGVDDRMDVRYKMFLEAQQEKSSLK